MAVYDSGKTYFVWANATWGVCIAYYDHVTGFTSDATIVGRFPDFDAHRNPSMLIDSSGFIYVFWGSHGDPTHVSRSRMARDISSFTARANITGLLNQTSYPQPHELTSGNITVLYRSGSGDWVSRTSSDACASWSSETAIAHSNLTEGDEGHGVYAICVSEEGSFPRKLHLLWTTIDISTQTRKHFWYAVFDGSWKKSDGTAYTLPIDETSGEKVFDSGTDQVNTQDIQLDSAGTPYVLISHGANGGNQAEAGGPWHFKLVKKKAGSWQSFDITQGDHQFDNGSLVIVADNDFRALLPTLASQVNEDGGNIEEWKSTDGGEIWTKIATLTSDPLSHNNVKTVRGHHPEFRAFWSYGDSTGPSDVTLRRYGTAGVTTITRS